MAQSADTSINAGLSGLAVRNGINENLAALFSSNSGASAPSPTVGGMLWLDTSVATPVLRMRNNANTEWLFVVTSAVRPDGLIAQGALSGSQLIVEIPTDFEALEITVWRYTPSVNGTTLKLTIGSGVISSPVWGAVHFQQGIVIASTTPNYYDNINQPSIDLSQPQNSAAGGYGRATLDGFHTTGAVRGTVSRVGYDTVGVNRASNDLVGEDAVVVHSLIRLSVGTGTMAGSYRITGYRKP